MIVMACGKRLACGGHIYVLDHKLDAHSTWRCELGASKCSGRGKLLHKQFVVTVNHSHPPDQAHVDHQILNSKSNALTTQHSAQTQAVDTVKGSAGVFSV